MDIAKWLAGPSAGLLLVAAPIAQAAVVPAKEAVGDWIGTLHAQGVNRHLAVHIHKTLQGGYAGTVDSPEQGGTSVQLSSIAAADGFLAYTAVDGTRYRGEWDSARGQWKGTWTDAGVRLPLNLKWDVDNALRVSPSSRSSGL